MSSNLTPLVENSDIGYDKQIFDNVIMSTKLANTATVPASKMTTADTFVGKRVVDREGIRYGKVKHIHINQDTLKVTGVTIHQGFRRDYFLDVDYIDKFTTETLLLNTSPIRTSVTVVDIDGHKIGKVKKLHKNTQTGDLESIEIQDGLIHTKVVSKAEIWGIGEKIILRVTKAEYKTLE